MWEYVAVKEDEKKKIEAGKVKTPSNGSELPSLNVDEGIHVCRGSSELYEEVLLEFAREADGIASHAQELYDARDWENYSIKLSGLKLSSRIIGADDLSRKAGEIEKAARDKWEAFIIANHDDLKRQIGAVKEDILRVYGGNAS